MDPDSPNSPDKKSSHSRETEVSGVPPTRQSGETGSGPSSAPKATEDTQVSEESPSFWIELKRRKVMRVAITYAVVAWVIIQIAATTFGSFGIPEWAFRFVVLMLVLGFPVALIITWAFELTPEGIKTTKSAREETEGTERSKSIEKKRNWFAVIFAAAVPTLIFGTLAIFFYFRPVTPEQSEGGSSSDSSSPLFAPSSLVTPDQRVGGLLTAIDKSIAVLPLENLSPDPNNAFFAGGVHEDILTNLSKIQDLRVISRTSTLDYVGANRKKSSEIASELNVRYLVEGSVRRAGNQVRVTVQLIDAPKDEHMWADNYDRSLDDIFAIQSEIAQAIASQVHATISPEELERLEKRPTQSQEAYDLYVKAQAEKSKAAGYAWPLDSILLSIGYLEQAVTLDPEFALAHSLLAYMHSIVHWFYSKDYPDTLEKARQYLQQAEALDPAMAELHLHRGYYYYWGFLDYARAAEEFALALSVQPNLAEAFYALSLVQRRQDRVREALENQVRGLQVDPRSTQLLNGLADSYAHFRRYAEALEVAEKLSQINPLEDRFQYQVQQIQFYLTGEVSLFLSSRRIGSEARLSSRKSFYNPELNPYYDLLYAGQFESALEWIASAEEDSALSLFFWYSLRAWCLWLMGDQEQARAAADIAIEESSRMNWELDKQDVDTIISLRNFAWLASMYAIKGNREKTVECRDVVRQGLIGTRGEFRNKADFEEDLLPSYLALGETEQALDILDDLLSGPGEVHAQEIRIDPWWRPFHGDSRFEAILAKAKPVQ